LKIRLKWLLKAKGEVKSTSSGTFTAAKIKQGFVLACSSTIEGDVAVALSE